MYGQSSIHPPPSSFPPSITFNRARQGIRHPQNPEIVPLESWYSNHMDNVEDFRRSVRSQIQGKPNSVKRYILHHHKIRVISQLPVHTQRSMLSILYEIEEQIPLASPQRHANRVQHNFMQGQAQNWEGAQEENMRKIIRDRKRIMELQSFEDQTIKLEEIRLRYSNIHPADEDSLKLHIEAHRFGKRHTNSLYLRDDEDYPISHQKICPCCGNFRVVEPFEMQQWTNLPFPSQNNRKIDELPLAITVFFTFIKMVIVFLLLRLLLFDIAAILMSQNGNYCSNFLKSHTEDYCVLNIYLSSPYNLKAASNQSQLNILDILNISLTILSIVFFIILRRLILFFQKREHQYSFIEQSDFQILIQDVPPFIWEDQDTLAQCISFNYKQIIKKQVNKKVKSWIKEIDSCPSESWLQEQLKQIQGWEYLKRQEFSPVVRVQVIYDSSELQNLRKMRAKLRSRYCPQSEQEILEDKPYLRHIPNQLKQLNKRQIQLLSRFVHDQNLDSEFKLSHFTGKALVTFQYEHFKQYFVNSYENLDSFFTICGEPIKISSANQTNDIHFQNMNFSDEQRSSKIGKSRTVLGMMLLFALFLLVGLQVWETTLSENSELPGVVPPSYLSVFSWAKSILTYFLNIFFAKMMVDLSFFERHKTETERLRSLLVKVILFEILNTCFFYIIIYLIYQSNPLGKSGLVSQILNVVYVSGILNISKTVVSPYISLIWSKIKTRWGILSKKRHQMFQGELNQSEQFPQYDFTSAYAFYINMTFIIAFYGYLVPFATPLLVVILVVQYWVDKCDVFKRYACPIQYNLSFNELVLRIFEVALLLNSICFMGWDLYIHYDSSIRYRVLNIVSIFISALYVAFMMLASDYEKRRLLCIPKILYSMSFQDYSAWERLKLYHQDSQSSPNRSRNT